MKNTEGHELCLRAENEDVVVVDFSRWLTLFDVADVDDEDDGNASKTFRHQKWKRKQKMASKLIFLCLAIVFLEMGSTEIVNSKFLKKIKSGTKFREKLNSTDAAKIKILKIKSGDNSYML